jgi:hypothetical protein
VSHGRSEPPVRVLSPRARLRRRASLADPVTGAGPSADGAAASLGALRSLVGLIRALTILFLHATFHFCQPFLQSLLTRVGSADLSSAQRTAILAHVAPFFARDKLNAAMPSGCKLVSKQRFAHARQQAALGQAGELPAKVESRRVATSDAAVTSVVEFAMREEHIARACRSPSCPSVVTCLTSTVN